MPLPSRRSRGPPPKYTESKETDSDEDFVDSGSEASIPEPLEEDEDSDNAFDENVEEHETASKKKKVTKKSPSASTSRISMESIKRNLMSAGQRNDPIQDPSSLEEPVISVKDLTEQEKLLPSFLNLSESDSDDSDEEGKSKRRSTYSDQPVDYKTLIEKEALVIAGPSKVKITSEITERLSDTGSDDDMEDVGDAVAPNIVINEVPEKAVPETKLNLDHLQEYTKLMEEAKQSLEQYKKKQLTISSKQDDFNIHQLLSIGESEVKKKEQKKKKTIQEVQDSDSDIEDLEEVKGEAKSQTNIPKGGIQLILDVPTDGRKEKKKQVDIEMIMKRRINRVKKEYQVFIHRVHVLCWLGHGNYVNNTLSDQSIMAAALSLIPSEKSYPDGRTDIKYIERITKWFSGSMIFKEDKYENKYRPNKKPLITNLLQQIEKKTVVSKKNMVLIFVAMLRAMGIKCRLVFSFRVTPLRPPELISLSLKNKDVSKDGDKKDSSKKPSNSSESRNKNEPGTSSEKSTKDASTKSVPMSPEKTNKKDSKSKPTPKTSKKSRSASARKAKDDSKSKTRIDLNDRISQLDGTDDGISVKTPASSRSQSRRNISLKRTPAKQPKIEPPSPQPSSSTTSSYWDQLMQGIGDTVKEPERLSHRDIVKTKESPYFKSPKVKVEKNSPIAKNLFDESTLLNDKISSDTTVADSTVPSNSNNRDRSPSFVHIFNTPKKPKTSNANETNNEDSSDKNISSSSDTHPSKRKSLSLSDKSRPSNQKTNVANLENGAKSKHVIGTPKSLKKFTEENETVHTTSAIVNKDGPKQNLTKMDMSPSTSKTRSNRNGTASNIEKVPKKVENSKKPKDVSNEPADCTEKSNKDAVACRRKSRRQSTDQKLVESHVEVSTNLKTCRKNIKEKIEKGLNGSFKIDDKDSKHDQIKDKRKSTRTRKSVAIVELEKEKINSYKSDGKEAKPKVEKKSKEAKEKVSKYFSPIKETVSNKGESSKCKRIGHRDLMVKCLAAGVSPQRDVTADLVGLVKGRVRESRALAQSKLVKGKASAESDEDSDYIEEEKVSPKPKARRVSEMSDADFQPKKKSPVIKSAKDRRVLSSDDEEVCKKKYVDVWCEVYVEEEEQWISVDIIKAQVHCPNEIYARSTHPVTYVVGWDNSSFVKDVTRRYVPHWNTTTRKLRTDSVWFEKALRPWMAPTAMRDVREDRQLDRMLQDAPLPKSIAEFKNHPLYALKRHLLKYEVIYPPDAPTLGFIRNEPVYARECVHTCRSRETWVKEAKVVKPAQEPYKIVKARPKYDRLSRNFIKDLPPLEIFGPWQVEDYVPPAAENGLVPRNAYGNVELFKACMLPKGTVHLQLPSLNKVARKLGIDCAPAMTGFDFHSGWSHPVYDGFVVCEEFKEVVIQAWEQEQKEAEARALEKMERRVYGNWKRLIRGLLIRERLKAKYDFKGVQEDKLGAGKGKKKSKGPSLLVKKRRACEKSSDSESS